MAKPIQDPLLGAALQKLFNLQGRVSPALDEIIVPTVQLADLGRGAPPAVARATTFAVFQTPAGAGQFATVRLEVPGNTLFQITKILVRSGTAHYLKASFTNAGAAQASTAVKSYTDGRLTDQNFSPASVVTFGTQAGGIAPLDWRGRISTTGSEFNPMHWVIGSGRPGQFGFVEFQSDVSNLDLALTIEGIEYSIV